MMEFGDTWAHEGIAEATKKALKARGITSVRADDKRYHDHLYFNVLTYMHGCSMGVAVHDRIKAEAQNPNVALEVGYLFALRKPVCLLKDKTLAALPADLVGWMYEPFDTLNPSETIPPPVSK
jgi:nucleoside 2-deoxyribosyltransferase